MFKNACVYAIEHWQAPTLGEFEQRASGARFVECAAGQSASVGWVAPRGGAHAALAESIGGQLILKLCSETKAVPAAVVRTEVEARLAQIEKDTGRRPRGKLVRELKEEVVHALLPRAFPKRVETWIWVDPAGRRVLVGAGSVKRADAVVTRLLDLLAGGCRLALVRTELAPARAMAGWLSDKQAPAGFTIDRDCELRQPDSEKSAVRYARHMLDIDEIGGHIEQGKQPTQLALTWQGRVSFVLTEALALKKIKLLDGVLDAAGGGAPHDGDAFDAEVAIITGELMRLLPDLLDALGGEPQRPAAVAPVTAAAAVTGSVAPWAAVPA